MLGGIFLMGGLGVVIGVVLAAASKIFYVYVDPKIEAVDEALPGANCGGCGYPGCSANAVAIVEGKSSPSSCVAGGPDVAVEVAQVMGVKVEVREPDFAKPGCYYGFHEADRKYLYDGINDCRAANILAGGSKVCPIGCIGLGTCVRSCPFGALSMGPENLPVVNEDLCTGCGTCERICPKHIITLSSATRRIVDEYETDECTAPCQRACPTGINIPRFINQINNGHYEKALLTIKEKCALPLVCGYICPAPCELNCRRNLVDEAVAINPLKRFVSDYEMATGKHIQPYKAPDNEKKVALIGGGSEGLTASYNLARLGYLPTIYEAKEELGGILRYVIAEDRLPRKILDHEVKGILDMGVSAKTGTVMGRDFSVGSLLKEGYDTVILTGGGFDSRKVLQPGQKRYDSAVQGLFMMLDFIKLMAQDSGLVKGKPVVIASAGQKELEIARKCMEMGAQKVILITSLPVDLLPMELRDRKALRAEGIEVKLQNMISNLSGSEDKLQQVTIEEIEPINPAMSQPQSIPAEVLVLAAGRLPELTFVRLEEEGSTETGLRWKTVETFKTFPESSGHGILSSPEPGRISDSSAVVKSILSGRRLARAVHQYFDGEEIAPIEKLTCETDKVINITEVQQVQSVERQRQSVLDVEGNSKTAWLYPKEFPGLEESAARRESDRCLQCGLICYKKSA